MRKIVFFILVLGLAIGVSACTEGEKATESQEVDKTTNDSTDLKKSLMKFYVSLTKTINEHDTYLNEYESSETDPTVEMIRKASESAAVVAEQLNKMDIPSELEEQKEDLEEVIADLKASYETKAEELQKEAPSLDEANETFLKADEALGSMLEEAGLKKSSINYEVNS